MRLYHGSSLFIDKIDMSLSKVGKDFGCGFYLSPDREQAEKMAAKKAEQIHSDTPCVTEFEFDESSRAELKVLEFDGYSKDGLNLPFLTVRTEQGSISMIMMLCVDR